MLLRHPASLDSTIEVLSKLVDEAQTILNTWPIKRPGYIGQAKNSYLQWVEDASRTITNWVDDEELLDHLRGHGYWRIYDLTEDDARPYPLVEHEIHLQQRRLNAVIAYLRRLKPFVDREGSIVMPDTSAFVQGLDFKQYDWTLLGLPVPIRLVVPVLVIEELEKVKCFDRGEGRNVARRVLRELRDLLRTVDVGEAASLRKDVTIEAFLDEDKHRRLENNDGEIIDQAVLVQRLTGRDVTIVSLDLPMELRARLRGVKVLTMPDKDEVTKTPALRS